ncbi:MAG: sugar phosphate isomerase/epimerase [Clostridia bacterium]|nr:sugar phosphate isomerase/epimerase [Clostridia bacterium]
MKISTSLELAVKIDRVSYRESARMMKRAGFDGVDFSLCRNQTEREKQLAPAWMEDVLIRAEAIRAEGLEIAQCHLPYFGNNIDRPGDGGYADYEAFVLPGLMRSIEACGQIGCRLAVIHPYFDAMSAPATRAGNLRLIEKLLPALEKHHVKLALENIYGTAYSDTGVSRAEGILSVIEAAGSELVGACIDTGHANIIGVDIVQMARLFGKKLFALHVNGNAGKDEHVIPYTMNGWCEKMDFYAFSAALKEIGFSGYYNLEIACGDLPEGIAQPFLNYAAAVARALADLAE